MILDTKHSVHVQNRKGHGYEGSGFLGYWEEEKEQKAAGCARIGCKGSADCGGHIY